MACNFQGAPDAKKPCKGILKSSSSFDKHSFAGHRKSAKFDEINVLQTYHPPDKDYGHMKIEEPKTPYRIADGDDDSCDQLDADLLSEKLREVGPRASIDNYSEESSDEEETEDSKMKRLEFEKRRKMHYNEFEAVRRARKLMEEDQEDEDEDEKQCDDTTADNNKGSKADSDNNSMDVDDNSTSAKQSSSSQAKNHAT